MRQLSDHALQLARRLFNEPNAVQRFFGASALDGKVLSELVQCGELGAVPYIAPTLAFGRRSDALAGAAAISALLAKAIPDDLTWLDEAMRESWVFSTPYGQDWRRLDPRVLAQWVGPGEPGALLFRIASFHSNGYIREAAIRRLALITDGSELPYLLLRLTDWVLQVRSAAAEAVVSRIRADYTEHFVHSLALVSRLQRVKRGDAGILQGITGLLTRREARSALLRALTSRSTEVRRASFRFLIAGDQTDLAQELLSVRIKDPSIRRWRVRWAGTALDRDRLLAALDTMLADRFAVVRREALGVLASAVPEQATDRLVAALMDPSESARDQALFYLSRHHEMDFAQYYRDALASTNPRQLAAAISGLAETGSASDAARVLPYLLHPRVRVRQTAVAALMRLGGSEYVPQVFERVEDESPGVSSQAMRLLQPWAGVIGAAELWTHFTGFLPFHVRRNLLRLMRTLSKWESITYLIRAAGDSDQQIASLAKDFVHRWNTRYNSTQTIPTKEQVRQLESTLGQWEHKINPKDAEQIKFALRLFMST